MTHQYVPIDYTLPGEEEIKERARNFYHLMQKRRTVREFSSEEVPEEVIEHAILTAGTAPSGANSQPWHFCAVKNTDLKKQIRQAAEEEERQSYQASESANRQDENVQLEKQLDKSFIEEAPVLLVVFKQQYRLEKGIRYQNHYVNESAGIATGFLITALHQAGLVMLTHTPRPPWLFNRLLQRPVNESPFVMMPTGYPAPQTRVPDLERKPADQIRTFFP